MVGLFEPLPPYCRGGVRSLLRCGDLLVRSKGDLDRSLLTLVPFLGRSVNGVWLLSFSGFMPFLGVILAMLPLLRSAVAFLVEVTFCSDLFIFLSCGVNISSSNRRSSSSNSVMSTLSCSKSGTACSWSLSDPAATLSALSAVS